MVDTQVAETLADIAKQNIRALRPNYVELAKRLQISRARISGWLCTPGLSLTSLEKLASVLGVPPWLLLMTSDELSTFLPVSDEAQIKIIETLLSRSET